MALKAVGPILQGVGGGRAGVGGTASPIIDILTSAGDPEVSVRATHEDWGRDWRVRAELRRLAEQAEAALAETGGTINVDLAAVAGQIGADGNDAAIGLADRGIAVARVNPQAAQPASVLLPESSGTVGTGISVRMSSGVATGANGNLWSLVVRDAVAGTPATPAQATLLNGKLVFASGMGAEDNGRTVRTTRNASTSDVSWAPGTGTHGQYSLSIQTGATYSQVLADLRASPFTASQDLTFALAGGTSGSDTVAGTDIDAGNTAVALSGGVNAVAGESASFTRDNATRVMTLVQDTTETLAQTAARIAADGHLATVQAGSVPPLAAGTYQFAGGVDAVAGVDPVYARDREMRLPHAEVLLWCDGAEQEHGLRLQIDAARQVLPLGAAGNDWTLRVVEADTGTAPAAVTILEVSQHVVVEISNANTGLTGSHVTVLREAGFTVAQIGNPVARELEVGTFDFEHGRDGVDRLLWINTADSQTQVAQAIDADSHYSATVDSSAVGSLTRAEQLARTYTPGTAAVAASTSPYLWQAPDFTYRLAVTADVSQGATPNGNNVNLNVRPASDVNQTYDIALQPSGALSVQVPTGALARDVPAQFNSLAASTAGLGWATDAVMTGQAFGGGTGDVAVTDATVQMQGGADATPASGHPGDPAIRFSGGRDADPLTVREGRVAVAAGGTTTEIVIPWNATVDRMQDIATMLNSYGAGVWYAGAAVPANVPEATGWTRTLGPISRPGGATMGSGLSAAEVQGLIDASITAHDTDDRHAGGDGSGLESVATDATISGDGTLASPLTIANEFTAADEAKLDGIEAAAKDDQTGAEIRDLLDALLGTGWRTGGGGTSQEYGARVYRTSANLGFSGTFQRSDVVPTPADDDELRTNDIIVAPAHIVRVNSVTGGQVSYTSIHHRPSFDIHDDVTRQVTITDADRLAFSDESAVGDPMSYTTLGNMRPSLINSNSVSSAAIQAGAVTNAKIGTAAVSSAKLGANAVTAAKVADNALRTRNIMDGQVTEAKLHADVVAQLGTGDGSSGPSTWPSTATTVFDGSGGDVTTTVANAGLPTGTEHDDITVGDVILVYNDTANTPSHAYEVNAKGASDFTAHLLFDFPETGGGTTVVANPAGTPTTALEKVTIDGADYVVASSVTVNAATNPVGVWYIHGATERWPADTPYTENPVSGHLRLRWAGDSPNEDYNNFDSTVGNIWLEPEPATDPDPSATYISSDIDTMNAVMSNMVFTLPSGRWNVFFQMKASWRQDTGTQWATMRRITSGTDDVVLSVGAGYQRAGGGDGETHVAPIHVLQFPTDGTEQFYFHFQTPQVSNQDRNNVAGFFILEKVA